MAMAKWWRGEESERRRNSIRRCVFMHSLISPHRTIQAIPLDATASRVAERDRTKKVGFRRWFSPVICSILRLQEAVVDDGEEAKCKPSLIR
ncbi:unnamed protein product [Linum trigynum]|uniref:Uncharacterized protein n=1 Tax=Linum trigynum TaxID=586398 RepID=A0AAV2GDE6_9ROSI